jgi:hypothetical protein
MSSGKKKIAAANNNMMAKTMASDTHTASTASTSPGIRL